MKLHALIMAAMTLLLAATAPTAQATETTQGSGEQKTKYLGCPDSGAITKGGFIKDVCWSCLFPMRLAGAGAVGKKFPADTAQAVCKCPSKVLFGTPTPGATFGMWKPTHFAETVRTPGCLAALGQKADMGKIIGLKQGGGGKDHPDSGFHSTHLYAFPTGAVLDMLTSAACSEDSYDLDLLMMTEIDPTYSNGELSMVVNPESFLFSNKVAVAACMVDSVASSSYRPIKELFWCFGSWGNTYPLSGYSNARSKVQDASIGSARLVAIQSKRLLMNRTYGDSAVCMAHPMPLYQKQQYRWQILYPMPQRTANDWTGAATILSREFRHVPVIGEDWVQVMWRYEECCVNIP